MSDIEFIDGLLVKAPRDNAPDFIKASLSIKRVELIAWLSKRTDEWVNSDVKVSKGGKWFVAVDNWKPDGKKGSDKPAKGKPANDFQDDEVPW
jgi:hypothetical protein